MKRFLVAFLALSIVALFFTGCYDEYFTAQRTFSRESLIEISPNGLVYDDIVGKNWWTGKYNGKNVLIHAIQTNNYVNVSFQYIETGEDK